MTTATAPASKPLGVFIPLTKVDEKNRIVYGVATAEAPDRSGEICDYASTRPYFESWSAEVAKGSRGLSLGNVREMHNRVAVGKLTDLKFNDADRQIEVAAKIIDDDAWQKVIEGVYTGFSQGGRYVKRWPDAETGLTRYTAEPTEISLVDLPCLPTATFDVVKAMTADTDGAPVVSTETRHFKAQVHEPSTGAIYLRAEELAKGAGNGVKPSAIHFEAAMQQLMSEEAEKAVRPPLGKTDDPTPSQIEERATHIAETEGGNEVTEGHRTRAKMELETEQQKPKSLSDGVDALNVPPGDPTNGATLIDANTLVADKTAQDEIRQVWFDPITRETFDAKRGAERARKARKAADAIKAVTGGVDSELDAIRANLGIEKKDYSDDDRKKLADEGKALPDGSFPIADREDLKNAVQSFGRAKDPDKAKAHIKARAKDLDAEDALPDDWKDAGKAAAIDNRSINLNRQAVDTRANEAPSHAERMAQHKTMLAFHSSQDGEGHMAAAVKHADAYNAHAAGADGAESKSQTAFAASRDCMGGACKGASAGDLVKAAMAKDGAMVPADKAAIHASMAHFHAQKAADGVANAEDHKKAAGAHAEAFLAHSAGAADADQKSDAAFQATTKCMGGAEKALEAQVVFGWPISKADAEKATAGLASARKAIAARLGKGLPTVAELASLIERLKWIGAAVAMESKQEGDDSPVVQQMKDAIAALCATLVAMTEEETRELINGQNVDDLDTAAMVFADRGVPVGWAARTAFGKFLSGMGLTKAAEAFARLPGGQLDSATAALSAAIEEQRDLDKIGSRNSAADQERVQKVHDLCGELGAACHAPSGKAAGASVADAFEKLDAAITENAALKARFADYEKAFSEIRVEVEKLKASPAPARAALFAVDRNSANGASGGSGPSMSKNDVEKWLASLTPEQRALELTKASLADPRRYVR